jgi:hypothetical protein
MRFILFSRAHTTGRTNPTQPFGEVINRKARLESSSWAVAKSDQVCLLVHRDHPVAITNSSLLYARKSITIATSGQRFNHCLRLDPVKPFPRELRKQGAIAAGTLPIERRL